MFNMRCRWALYKQQLIQLLLAPVVISTIAFKTSLPFANYCMDSCFFYFEEDKLRSTTIYLTVSSVRPLNILAIFLNLILIWYLWLWIIMLLAAWPPNLGDQITALAFNLKMQDKENADRGVDDKKEEDPLCCEELKYCVKRLVKGLASSRKGARHGFATVLTEILSKFRCLTPEVVLGLIAKHLEIIGNAKAAVW